ncbi:MULTISPECIES: GreA/GreB family elongation factor [Sphingomonadaceae]|uniref:Transcription elongation factor n=1 Tax=Sphingomonas bisphenolicum TaxID=296544 RepID=A0ABM7FY47_9SPHN|nr:MULTISPECIES: GreA/GreB family elongation factor [Sphingomonadaceae]MBA4091196.1 nucleoside-diphosphate kinase [Sphingobium sp.]MBZ9647718.1 GreA/GreB family elongation factor [Sphingobium sp. 3R8]BBF68653.1 transcription elongation factor [Sphingomonas bisphenolicum]
MSVAFRRESDDEHMEPKFELPIPPGPNWVTARGLRLTREKVEALEAVDTAAMEEEAAKKHKRVLRYWRTRRATAELQAAPGGDAVAFGTRVTYRLNRQERTVALVGDDEADPNEGRISFSAPLARAMMDAAVGEKVDFAGKSEAVEIVQIAVASEA